MTVLRDFTSPAPVLDGKAILVTGGTGSFGRRFVASLLGRYRPKRLVVFSRDELKQWEMARELAASQSPALRFFIGDVRSRDRLVSAMRGVDMVIHAAALKQVIAAEYNPFECIHTNVLGAENVAQAAIDAGVRQVIALSTDKAASPANLYGASKLASDKIFIAANNLSGATGTRFSVVRYGNVIGSRGSVVPLFRELLDGGATELPITDPRMTRFWITLQQGVDFVLSCAPMMRGGEIFVPKLPTVSITDLARVMAPTATLKTVGIRPGEKVHEALITVDEGRNAVELDDRYIIQPAIAFWDRGSIAPELGARPTPDDFEYTSDGNPERLAGEELRGVLRASGFA